MQWCIQMIWLRFAQWLELMIILWLRFSIKIRFRCSLRELASESLSRTERTGAENSRQFFAVLGIRNVSRLSTIWELSKFILQELRNVWVCLYWQHYRQPSHSHFTWYPFHIVCQLFFVNYYAWWSWTHSKHMHQNKEMVLYAPIIIIRKVKYPYTFHFQRRSEQRVLAIFSLFAVAWINNCLKSASKDNGHKGGHQ